tara:strand:- start:438 stop:728 length:291 start_codon:yes stop_codon:yes gene_type:complete
MTIKIVELERNLSDGTVTVVHWYAILEDGEYSVGTSGTVSLVRDDNSAAFISYDALTEAKIIEWVKAEWESPEDRLKAELAELKTPTKAKGLPWKY